MSPTDGEGDGREEGAAGRQPPEPLSSNGTGGAHAPEAREGPPARSRWPMTQEDQSCFGCVALIVIVVVSLLFWLFIYWRNADEFNSQVPHTGGGHTLAGLSGREFSDPSA